MILNMYIEDRSRCPWRTSLPGKVSCSCSGPGEICGPMFDLIIMERGSFCSAVATPRPHHTAPPDCDDDTTGRANDEFAVSDVRNKRTPYPKDDTSVHATGGRHRTRHLGPLVLWITAKIFLAAWVEEEMFKSFYMAYLTHWGYSITSMYAIASPICAIYLAERHRSSLSTNNITTSLTCCCGAGSDGGVAGFLIKTTWALFSIALPVEIAIAILFWTTVYEFKSSEAVTYVTGMFQLWQIHSKLRSKILCWGQALLMTKKSS